MNRILWILLIVVVALIFCLQVAIIYVKVALPGLGPAPIITVQKTTERLERGKYLANHVAVCMDCHSTRDWTFFSGPLKPKTLGMGGERFGREMGFPGEYYSSNITPYGISGYSDGELYRLITTGVKSDGKPIFPVMPYHNYGKLDPEDIYSIIAYVRSLAPITNDVTPSKTDFPMSVILNTIPKAATMAPAPATNDTLAYGKYLATMASCVDCHTQFVKGQPVAGMEYAGGREFPMPSGHIIRSANITPDKETGLGWTTRGTFISKFKQYSDSGYVLPKVGLNDVNTIMPWTMYTGMKEDDLAAIFKYLQSLKPIKNKVEPFSKPS
ncbi:MAG: c-type cytochrome [Bacteroidota bacterium]|nr:c-type cytochrome [Bacteroidota bacterium]